jgi:hypothetical protein
MGEDKDKHTITTHSSAKQGARTKSTSVVYCVVVFQYQFELEKKTRECECTFVVPTWEYRDRHPVSTVLVLLA